MIRKLFGRLASVRSFIVAAFALALSTTSAFAAITVHTENCTLPDGYTYKNWDVYYYYDPGDTRNVFEVGENEEFTVTVNSGLPSWANHYDALYNFWAYPAEEAGEYEISIKVTNTTTGEERDIVLSATILVTPPEVIDGETSLPSLVKGIASSVTLEGSVQYGTTPYIFTKTSGNLPAGVTLNSNGSLDGTPTEAGTFTFYVTVTDSTSPSFTLENVEYTLTVIDTVAMEYRDSNGVSQTTNCVELTEDMTELGSGWYVAQGTLSYANGTSITVSGEVNLILAADSSMTITRGANNTAGIVVSDVNTLNIYGQSTGAGSLTVTGGASGAGIGGGRMGNGGTVTINGGTVNATGGNYGAGIGGGRMGNGGTVTINGGTVTATGGGTTSTTRGSGIGAGKSGLSHGTLTVGSNMEVKAGSSANPTDIMNPISLGGEQYYVVSQAAAPTTEYSITYMSNGSPINLSPATYTKGDGLASLPTPESAPVGYAFGGWYVADSLTGDPVTSIAPGTSGPKTFYAKWVAATETISYLDENGVEQYATCTSIIAESRTLTAGWYMVTDTVEINGTLTVSDNAKIVLKDGATLTVQNGSWQNTITIAENKTLTVYGQANGTGSLNATATSSGYSGIAGTLIIPASLSAYGALTGSPTTYLTRNVETGIVTLTDRYNNVLGSIAIVPSTPCTITYMDGETPMGGLAPTTYFKGSGATLPTADTVTKPNYVFAGWYTVANPNPVIHAPVTAIAASSDAVTESDNKTYYAQWEKGPAPKIRISFVGADGAPTEEECTVLDSDMSTLNEGWYVVKDDVEYATGGITVNGNVNLVLVDGVKLTVTNVSSGAAIEVTSGNSLSIYAQTRGTGAIEAKGKAAGIGGGSSCGKVSIHGGVVTAIGATTDAGIGGGMNGNGGEIIITGGSVTAYSRGAGAGIGGGYGAASQGTLTVAAGVGVYSKALGDLDYADVSVDDETYAVTLDGKKYYIVAKKCEIEYMDGETKLTGLAPTNYVPGVGTTLAATAESSTPGYAFAGWYENSWLGGSPVTVVPASATGKQTFYAKWKPIEYTVTFKKGALTLDLGPQTYTVETSPILRTLPSTAPADPGKVFAGWCLDEGLTGDLLTAIPENSTGNLTFYAKYRNITSDSIPVDFVAADGTPKKETCEVFIKDMRYLDAQWYVVTNNITLTDPLTIEGNVNLVLEDGVKLTVYSTIRGQAAVSVPGGSSLTIYGQSEGTGELAAIGTNDGCGIGGMFSRAGGSLTINGGTVTATGGSSGAGIGSDYDGSFGTVTINAGTVTATGGNDAGAGIGGSRDGNGISVVINGGMVTATGGFFNESTTMYGAGIGGGYSASNHGSLTVGPGVKVESGASRSNLSELEPGAGGVITLDGKRCYVVSPAPAEGDWPADTSTVAGQTAAEAYGVTGDLADVDAKKLADWAKANSVDYDATIITDAYVLGCANTAEAVAVATPVAEEAIKITAITFDSEGNPVLACPAIYGNGKVVVEGAASLTSPMQWHEKTSGDKFFRTVLKP